MVLGVFEHGSGSRYPSMNLETPLLTPMSLYRCFSFLVVVCNILFAAVLSRDVVALIAEHCE